MKFHEALAQARAEQIDRAAQIAPAVLPVTAGVEPTVRAMFVVTEAALTTAETCKVWTSNGMLRDLDITRFPSGPHIQYGGEVRKATRYPVALPAGENPTGAGQIYYVAYLNGRYWAFAPAATTCTTTSTTTRPPCTCSGDHPDMQLTLTAITTGPASLCIDTAGNDLFCRYWNKTWCLYYRGGNPCFWISDPLAPACAPFEYRPWIELYWPSEYHSGCGATPGDCTSATLIVGGIRYSSCDYNPDTGGTFTRDADYDGVGYNDCRTFPASITVTATSGCTTTTSTTTTSTTTTTTTTTTTSTTTSTTTAPPFCGTCAYQWNGTSWDFVSNSCTGSCNCVAPVDTGTFVGQPRTTDCV